MPPIALCRFNLLGLGVQGPLGDLETKCMFACIVPAGFCLRPDPQTSGFLIKM